MSATNLNALDLISLKFERSYQRFLGNEITSIGVRFAKPFRNLREINVHFAH